MSKYYAKPAHLIALATCGVLVLATGAICGTSYLSAARTGADFESSLVAARKLVQSTDEEFQQELARVAGVESVSESQAHYAIRMSMRRPGPEGTQFALRWLKERDQDGIRVIAPPRTELSPQVLKEASMLMGQYRSKSFRFRRSVATLTKDYKASLDSGWAGFWLQTAGYPTVPLESPKSKAKPRGPSSPSAKPPGKAKAAKTPVPAAAPVAAEAAGAQPEG